ncbi:hypothetical protein [Micromonospora sp. WMMD1120]|uniref:hypothetical protein n=1 Tax=Micromonospora sp. WMMD1120 TaxID=3016106 RepID=UPI003241CBB6
MEDALVLADVRADSAWSVAGARFEASRHGVRRVDHIAKMTDLTSRSARTPAWIRRLLLRRTYRATYEPLSRPVEVGPLPARRSFSSIK